VVIQTAFLGDVVLTLPLVRAIRNVRPGAAVDLVVAPRAAAVLAAHPDIRETIIYDKRGRDAGASGFLRLLRELRRRNYAAAIVPHRSIRSAMLALTAGIPVRAGFDASSGRWLFTHVAPYDRSAHEIDRNLRLLEEIGAGKQERTAPRLYPSGADREAVDRFLARHRTVREAGMIAIAPGTVWNTKRWPQDRFAALARMLCDAGFEVALVGGPEDAELCRGIAATAGGAGIIDASGSFSVLGSAELIRRAEVLVCNDSAPLHLAGAVGTPVLAIFGATTPAFGFGPIGPGDRVLQIAGLGCRPCSIHGGDRCPIDTFDCMERITPAMAAEAVRSMAGGRQA
jgi:heptosyltransferase-2